MPIYPSVSIIILNWNGWEDTIECLESLYNISYSNYQIILVDNGSHDHSLKKIEEYANGKIKPKSKNVEYSSTKHPIKILSYSKKEAELGLNKYEKLMTSLSNRKMFLIKNEVNYGFAEGNNIGMRFALNVLSTDYIMLLNNDTVVDKDFLSKLVMVSESDDAIGIIGPKNYYYDFEGQDNVINFAGGKINWLQYPGYHHIGNHIKDTKSSVYAGSMECDWITGAAIMIRAKYLPSDLLNNTYFFGCEDVDLCMRFKKQGYKIIVNLDSLIWHKIGVSRKKIASSMLKVFLKDVKTNLRLLKNSSKLYVFILLLYTPQIIGIFTKITMEAAMQFLKEDNPD